MRRVGLILMVGVLLAAGGVGLGWLAAELKLDGSLATDPASGAEAQPALQAAAGPSGDAPSTDPFRSTGSKRLQAAAERAGSLEGEIARLRWQLADRRRLCQPETAAEPPPPVPQVAQLAAADGGPRSQIHSPAPDAPPEPPMVADAPPPPAFAPAREPAPPPQRLAAAEPATVPPPFEPPPAATPPTPPPVVHQPGQALTVPEAAVRSGDVSFLEGCWVSSPFSNPVNGLASTKVYCFDRAGNGQMNFSGSDGVTCSAPIRARWEPGPRLVLEEPRDGQCSNFGPWYRESTNCAIGGDGRAQCNSYEFYRRFNYGTRLTRT